MRTLTTNVYWVKIFVSSFTISECGGKGCVGENYCKNCSLVDIWQ